MEQSDIIFEVTNRFADKFKGISRVKIKDSHEDKQKESEPMILLTLVGIEELKNQNMNREIQLKGTDEAGKEIEYFVKPASLFSLTYMITPYFKTYSDSLKILGSIVKHLKDSNTIPVDEYDWVENEKNPILIEPLTGMTFEKQMQFCNLLRTEYWPSLFYQLMIGINSSLRESFTRVKERRIDIGKMPDKPA